MLAGLVLPAAAVASEATLQRATQNLLFAPVDLALAPLVAGQVIHDNLQHTDDPPLVRGIFVVPGLVWSTAVQTGGALIRGITGAIEWVPGLLLLPFDADLPVLFVPSEIGNAWVDVETPLLRMRFGIDYLRTGRPGTSLGSPS